MTCYLYSLNERGAVAWSDVADDAERGKAQSTSC